ncbi:hypothetical protein [Lacimicrobium alkaliphilum]|uniref:Uncharacterized protein n=1 Tax=Lacimicrobium alkaliphilum TaxID=1526571 RepID=A0ABQ1RAA4_9ALTE|nr:hypothetical protein [Lacimicrobium alkaliphilum]GGD63000.1 hypothetical protein GCM10011357_17870 [Lacimicrobium alkaliphilum]
MTSGYSTLKWAHLMTVLAISASSYASFDASSASELQVLTADNRLDVGNAKILAGKLEQICTSRFHNQAQAFQCKSACGGLDEAVSGVSTHINRQANPTIIKNSLKTLVQRTLQCNQRWQRDFPQEFKPFALLLKSLHEGRMPQPGKPAPQLQNNPAHYAENLKQLAPQLSSLGNVCHESLFRDSCLKSCDISTDSVNLAETLQQGTWQSLSSMNEETPWVKALRTTSTALHQKTRQCAKHYGRTPAGVLSSVQLISKTVQDKANEVYSRHLETEKLRREELARQRDAELQQRNAERQQRKTEEQHRYQQEVARLHQCRNDSPFDGYSGCSYLTAIYDGNFQQAISLELQTSNQFKDGWLSKTNRELAKGTPLEFLTALQDTGYRAFTFIDKLITVYSAYYSAAYPGCLGDNPIEITLTTEVSTEYKNGFGSVVHFTKHLETDYLLIPRRLYDKFGLAGIGTRGLGISTIAEQALKAGSEQQGLSTLDVTMGLSSAMDNYGCDSATMRKLEQQMLSYQAHRQQYNRQFGGG